MGGDRSRRYWIARDHRTRASLLAFGVMGMPTLTSIESLKGLSSLIDSGSLSSTCRSQTATTN